MHIQAPDGTPMANPLLTVLNGLGIDMPTFGNSTAALDLNSVSEPTKTVA